jgi:hypothetical protein
VEYGRQKGIAHPRPVEIFMKRDALIMAGIPKQIRILILQSIQGMLI